MEFKKHFSSPTIPVSKILLREDSHGKCLTLFLNEPGRYYRPERGSPRRGGWMASPWREIPENRIPQATRAPSF